jgi:hypothetical protein
MHLSSAERRTLDDEWYFHIIIKTNSNEFNYFLGMTKKSPSAGGMNLDPPSA